MVSTILRKFYIQVAHAEHVTFDDFIIVTCRMHEFVTMTVYWWLSSIFACLVGSLFDFHHHSKSDFDLFVQKNDFDFKSLCN